MGIAGSRLNPLRPSPELSRGSIHEPESSPTDSMILNWFVEFGDELYRFARRRVGTDSLAEDLVQDTFVAAIEGGNHRQVAEIESPRAFLLTIMRRKIADHYRRECRQRDKIGLEAVPDASAEATHWPDPTAGLCHDELKAALANCTERLPLTMRRAFELRVLRRLDVDETADLLGVSSKVLAARLYRSRLAIRDCLAVFFK